MFFNRIVVGVDGSPEGFVALAQARRLLVEGGELLAVVVCQEHLAVHVGFEAPRVADDLHAEAEAAAERARAELAGLPGARVELVHGHALAVLSERAHSLGAGLVAIGSHSHSRAAGILLGSVATAMLHESHAAVLVARDAAGQDRFPVRIVAGTDGSAAAAAAVAVARSLAERLRVPLRVLVAEGGKPPLVEGVDVAGATDRDPRPPVEALVAAGEGGDLVVVGSRGLHGLAAVGSVSERVAHRAACSVLVIRPAVARVASEVRAGELAPA